jgi:hypothetical protein
VTAPEQALEPEPDAWTHTHYGHICHVPSCAAEGGKEGRVLARYDAKRHRKPPIEQLESAPVTARRAMAGRLLIAHEECTVRYNTKLRVGDLFGAQVEDALRMWIREGIRAACPEMLPV